MPRETYVTLRIAQGEGVATLTIDHPPLNVLDAMLITELRRFAVAAREDDALRVIVLQSADPEFFICHGDMNFVTDPDSFVRLADPEGDPALNPMQQLHERWRALPQITIAKLAGFARGGGHELAMALDMRFAAIGPTGVAQPEAMMGIIPGGGGTQYLSCLAGHAKALEVILGGALFDAEMAERYGLVNRALPAAELDGFVDALARHIAALPAGVAAAAKAAIAGVGAPSAAGLRQENTLLGQLFSAPAATDRILAALKHGGQTRKGERDLEGLLNSI